MTNFTQAEAERLISMVHNSGVAVWLEGDHYVFSNLLLHDEVIRSEERERMLEEGYVLRPKEDDHLECCGDMGDHE